MIGESGEAERFFRKALSINQNLTKAYYNLGFI